MTKRRDVLAGAAALTLAPIPAAAEPPMLTRLRDLRALVLDPDRTFSIGRTLAELDEIEPKIRDTGPESPERGELNYVRGLVLFKAKRPEESIPPSLEAIRIDAAAPFLTPPLRVGLHHTVAVQAQELGRWPLAIEHYRKVLSLWGSGQGRDEDQRLGTLQRLAFCLHEERRPAEAKAANEEVLAGGGRLHGEDSPKLLTVLNNLAQNVYDLGDKPAAGRLLERRLAIALKHGEDEESEDTLFQLGVLAFETGRRGEAETLMKRRLALAEKSRDADRIAAARRDLDELYERMKK